MRALFIGFNFFILFLFQAEASLYPYETLDSSYKDNTVPIEITPSTPVKAQDGIGLCYGFSTTSLLENYRCRELNLNCSDPHEFLSSLDVTSYYERKSLIEGGNAYRILSNLQSSKRKVAKEECVQFSALVHQMTDYKNNTYSNEKVGWSFLIKKWNEFKGLGKDVVRNDCVGCMADEIKKTLPNIQTPMDQLKDAFTSAHTMEEFLYKTILPSQCLDENKMANIPEFVTRTYPGFNDKVDAEGIAKKIESLLLSNIPVEIGICTQKDFNEKCMENNGHSIALFGIKEVCSHSKNDCRTMVKVKNSYGNSWQLQNNGGWIDLQSLAESSILLEKNNNISWIEKPGFKLVDKTLSKKSTRVITPPTDTRNNSNIAVPGEYKNYKGIWKCPGNKFIDHYESGCVPMR